MVVEKDELNDLLDQLEALKKDLIARLGAINCLSSLPINIGIMPDLDFAEILGKIMCLESQVRRLKA